MGNNIQLNRQGHERNKTYNNSNCEILENKLCNLFFGVLWAQAIQELKTDFTENFFLEIMSSIQS